VSDFCAVCSTSDDIISNSGCDRVSMHGIHLCDVDIIDIKLSDNVALYLFCLLGLAWVWFVRKVLGWIRLGWVGSLRKWAGSG